MTAESRGERRAGPCTTHLERVQDLPATLPPSPPETGRGVSGAAGGKGDKGGGRGRGDAGGEETRVQLAAGEQRSWRRVAVPAAPPPPTPGPGLARRAGHPGGRERGRPNPDLVRLAWQRSGDGAPRAPAYLEREVRVRSRDTGRGSCQLLLATLQVSEAHWSPSYPPPRAPRTPSSGPGPRRPPAHPPPAALRRAPLLPLLFIPESGGPSPETSLPQRVHAHTSPQKRALFSEGAAMRVLEILGLGDFRKTLLKSWIYPMRFKGGTTSNRPCLHPRRPYPHH